MELLGGFKSPGTRKSMASRRHPAGAGIRPEKSLTNARSRKKNQYGATRGDLVDDPLQIRRTGSPAMPR